MITMVTTDTRSSDRPRSSPWCFVSCVRLRASRRRPSACRAHTRQPSASSPSSPPSPRCSSPSARGRRSSPSAASTTTRPRSQAAARRRAARPRSRAHPLAPARPRDRLREPGGPAAQLERATIPMFVYKHAGLADITDHHPAAGRAGRPRRRGRARWSRDRRPARRASRNACRAAAAAHAARLRPRCAARCAGSTRAAASASSTTC